MRGVGDARSSWLASVMKHTDPVYPHGGSALRGDYLVKNRSLNGFLRLRDAGWRLLMRRSPGGPATPPVRKVLISVGGHLGDAVIATSVIPLLASRFPGVEIGVLCSTLNASVFESHPQLSHIHRYDHWFTSRAKSRLASALE